MEPAEFPLKTKGPTMHGAPITAKSDACVWRTVEPTYDKFAICWLTSAGRRGGNASAEPAHGLCS
jgi:hypothetical protein